MDILVINAGSSSLKYQLIDMKTQAVTAKGIAERIGIEGSQLKHFPEGKATVVIKKDMKNHSQAIKMVLDALLDSQHGVIESLDEISAIGHRVVHGGEFFSGSVKIDRIVKGAIRACFDMAPLHNPANLVGIEACEEVMPDVVQVAVFDTAFHQTMPKHAYMYALPYEYYEKHKIRKYGFHGTSHKYVAERAAIMLGKPTSELRLITVHLGNGSSVCAVENGKSIDTSMGYTPLAGVVMGTRCGNIDPAVVPFLMDKEGLTTEQVSDVMNKESGVLGISGISSDFRDLVDAWEDGNKRAKLALQMFAYSVKSYITTYAGVMGGADAVIFTAGVGENSTKVRAMCIENLEFMGMKLDPEKIHIRGKEADISTADSPCRILVIPTNEELMIAIETEKLLKA